MKRAAAALLAILLAAPPLRAQPTDASPGERTAYAFVGNVVRITTRPADGSPGEDGFGFVFGERRGKLYVATADHVIMRDPSGEAINPQVVFHDAQGEPQNAKVLKVRLPRQSGDLAVLEVPKSADFEPHWIGIVNGADLQQGDHAWRIGKSEHWIPSSVPGTFTQYEGTWLDFDNLDTPRGSSGGPIVTANGLVGMVTTDSGLAGGISQVLPIETIRGKVRDWGLPWNLNGRTEDAPAAPPPPQPAPPQGQAASNPAPSYQSAATQPASIQPIPRRYYAGEADSHGVNPQIWLQDLNVASWTPTSIPGGRTIYTTDLESMMQMATAGRLRFVLIDALANFHAQTILKSLRAPYAGNPGFIGDAAQQHLASDLSNWTYGNRSMPVVFFCRGPACWESYNACLRAIALGYQYVLWYRGGLNAWEEAGLPENP